MTVTLDEAAADPEQVIADLRRQLDEALARETAIAEVLQVINSSPGDLTPVFDTVVEKAMTLCDAANGVLRTYDGELFHLVSACGDPDAVKRLRELGPIRPSSIFTPIVQGEPVVHMTDAHDTDAYRNQPGARERINIFGIRTWMAVPLSKDGVVLGAIAVFRTEVRPFSNSQIALLQNFAAQAVIAMENARLITATREALEQQTATAEVLQVINSSPGDLAPVFDVMLEKALRLCEAAFGILFIREGEQLRAVATRNLPQSLTSFVQEPFQPSPAGFFEKAAKGEDYEHIVDLSTEVSRVAGDPRARAFVELGGARTTLSKALRKDGAVLGWFGIYRCEIQPFTDKQIALLENFAAQAVIAMENARLITETREALEQQTATAEVLGVINSSPGDLAPVFDAILEKAHALCGAEYGVLLTYDGERFWPVGTHGDTFSSRAAQEGIRPGSGFGKLLRGDRLLHIHDMAELAAQMPDDPIPRALVEVSGIRTQLAVPLRKDDKLLGIITANRREVHPFTDKQITLLENFAAQAVIAMENARLLGELRQRTGDLEEALAQQTATAEVLGVINSSPGDLAPVFEVVLDRAICLCEAAYGVLWTYNAEGFRAATLHGVPQAYAAHLAQQPTQFARGTDTALGQIAEGSDFAHFDDVATEEGYMASGARRLIELGGARTVMVVALRKDDKLLGAISAFRQEVRPFSDKQIALLQNFAAQAVIAMENARLITETREALDQQTATAEVLQVINASPGDLTPVFDTILEKARAVCGFEHGSLNVFDGEYFRTVATHGVPEAFAEVLRQPRRAGPQTRFLDGERIVHVPDITAEAPAGDNPVHHAAVAAGIRTVLFVPLRNEHRLLGYLTANRREVHPFSEKQIALLENFAAQAVIAMENARLLDELRQRTDDVQEALEYQIATSDVLKVISRSTFDLQPVLDTLIETAGRLCVADSGHIFRREGEGYRWVASFGLSPEYEEQIAIAFRQGMTLVGIDRGSIVGRVALQGGVIHVLDAEADPEYRRPDAARFGRIRAVLGVPLLRESTPVGAITLWRQRVEPFTDRQIELVRTFADQAVIAIENARLLGELRQRTDEVAELNRGLEARVAEQVEELGRVGRLKRFLAPQLAELIVSQGDEKILESHRREIVVVFCDLRGYTAFAETAEPEEVLDFLREYHGALGPLVSQFEGTLDQFSGDGIMVFFNDPVPIPDPAERAVKMAMAMRETAGDLIAAWRERGRELGFGAGIAQGYATLGQIGFSERSGYTAIGTVCNVAARLCAEAKDGQILLSQRVNVALRGSVATEQLGTVTLKGLTQPVVAYNVPLAAGQPALRVIEGGPQNI